MNVGDLYPRALSVLSVYHLTEDGTRRASIVTLALEGGGSKTIVSNFDVALDGSVPTHVVDGKTIPMQYEPADASTWRPIERVLRALPDPSAIGRCAVLRPKTGAELPARALCFPGLVVGSGDAHPTFSLEATIKLALACARQAIAPIEGVSIAFAQPTAIGFVGDAGLPPLSLAEGSPSAQWLEVWTLPEGWSVEAQA